jgi:hypothetical protein
LSKRATSNSVRAGSSSTLRGQENEANLCHISTLERAPLGPGKPLLHAQESSHYPWSCHAKPMTSTQSMHHKLPGSEILLRFKSKTSCCSVAVTTKQTRRCHRDGSFGTKRIKKTNFIFIYYNNIILHLYHVVYCISLYCVVRRKTCATHSNPMPRSQGFQQKGRAQGLGQLTQPGIFKVTLW